MGKIITSLDNNLVKKIKKLSNKKYRNQLGLYIIESRKMIDEAIQSSVKIESIIVRENVKNIYNSEMVFSETLFNKLSTLVNPDGYMAIVKKSINHDIKDKVLVLDKLQDPGNMGTLIRSAEAFGFNTILAIDSVDYYNEKVLRSSMGSIFRLNLFEINYDFLDKLEDYDIYIADMDGEDYREINASNKIAIVIGNEGNGVSENILSKRHNKISIPMQGKIESLNAAISGSILMSKFML